MNLADLTWTQVAGSAASRVVAVPVGSTEQHGPHLPLHTDTAIAEELAGRLAARRSDVLVAPAVSYGSSGEHAGFPGTLSIGGPVLEALLIELGRSSDAFGGILFVSTHGGNAGAVRAAVERLTTEGRCAKAWSPPPLGTARADAHAGFTETSVMMAIEGSAPVQIAPAGCATPLEELMPVLVTQGVRAVSDSGVLGDPTGASPDAGREILDGWAQDLVRSVDGWP